MNENKKLLVILGIVVLVILAIIGSSVLGTKKQEETIKEIEKLMDSKTGELIYLGRPTCTYCEKFSPILESASDKYQFGYYYLNTDELSSTNLTKVLELLEIDPDSFGTPTLAVVKNGKKEAVQPGYTDAEGLFKFLQSNKIISEDAAYESDDANLNKIDYEQYKEIINSNEKQIIVFAQTGCSHCEEARPNLNEIAKDYDITINYLNITDLSADDQSSMTESLDILKDGFGTPLTIIIENKKVIDSLEGFESKDSMIDFFKKNGFIEE